MEEVGFTFDEIIVSEEESYYDLELDETPAIIGEANKTKANISYEDDGYEKDNTTYDLDYKATEYNIAYGFNLKVADEEATIADDDIIYRLSLDDGTIAITKNEKNVKNVGYMFTSYPFVWKQDPSFDEAKDEIRDFILSIPGKGSIEIVGRFQLVHSLEG